MRKPLVAGNWKMHMTRPQALELVRSLKRRLPGGLQEAEVVLAPPFTALDCVSKEIQGTNWALAGQNGFWEKEGAFTGEISFPMLAELGCRFVILGHSERRQIFGESDQWVQKKVTAAMASGLTPIVCVGETLDERDQGQTLEIVESQLQKAFEGMETDPGSGDFLVAYEPVWAIGTGRTATPEQAQEVHLKIRDWLRNRFSQKRADSTRILYGGSVKPDNIEALMACPDIDGALVGGASLQVESFARIVELART